MRRYAWVFRFDVDEFVESIGIEITHSMKTASRH